MAINGGKAEETKDSYSDFYNYFTIYLDNFQKIEEKIMTSLDTLEELKNQITETVADALKFAQIQVKNMPEYSHPVFWAGFSYYGL